MLEGCIIDLLNGRVILASGDVCPITNFLDVMGNDTGSLNDIACCVGPLPDGNWFALQVMARDRPVMH